jgi:hypothetical protein
MSRRKDTCSTDGCSDDVKYPTLHLCAACYAYFYYHKHYMSVKEELMYLKKQERIAGRVELLAKKAKARPMSKRKSKAA